MSKIYTKTGDTGTTSLLSGKRVKKYDIRVTAYGNVDELSSYLGLLRGYNISENTKEDLIKIQRVLFNIMGLLACDDKKFESKLKPVTDTEITFLEKTIDEMSKDLPPFKYFILPGGTVEIGMVHICRTVCRRTERKIVELTDQTPINNNIVIFINRLSDYLFALSRKIAKDTNFEQTKA